MTYNEFIQNIIDTRGQWSIPEGEYYEKHHIVPRCLGGKSDTKYGTFKKNSHNSNCIWLYPAEHFIAHKLLALENKSNSKLVFAWQAMFIIKNGKRYETTSEEYEIARILFAKHLSELNTGKTFTEDHRQHISDACKNRQSSFKGKHHTEEAKQKMSAAATGRANPNKGKKLKSLTKEHREKISKGLKNRLPPSDETRLKLSLANKGKIHINNGEIEKVIPKDNLDLYIALGFSIGPLPCTAETRKALSNALLGHMVSDETRLKLSKAFKNRMHITNGILNKNIYESELQDYLNKGWKPGRTIKSNPSNKRKCRCIETGEVFESVAAAHLKYKGHIQECLNGKRKTAAGYHWEEVKEL